MTNLEIQKHAARFAEHIAARAERLDSEDAWYRWSAEHSMTGPAARHLFQHVYELRMARLGRRRAH